LVLKKETRMKTSRLAIRKSAAEFLPQFFGNSLHYVSVCPQRGFANIFRPSATIPETSSIGDDEVARKLFPDDADTDL
jgi:hypothetical protein